MSEQVYWPPCCEEKLRLRAINAELDRGAALVIAERDRLRDINAELLAALEEQLGAPFDMTDAPCHRGITTAEKCGRCSRETRARAAIASAKGEAT